MLALNGIFILVTQHGLEYPQFYTRLYQLITKEAFAAKHRAQFFKLADLFLSSGEPPGWRWRVSRVPRTNPPSVSAS